MNEEKTNVNEPPENSNTLDHKGSVIAVSALSTAIIAAANGWLPEAHQEPVTAIAPLVSGIIIYFAAGLINRYGFEDPQLAARRRRLKKDVTMIEKELKKELPQKTKDMLETQHYETLKELTSLNHHRN